MRQTWYVLENGNAADPAECAYDSAGVLRNKSGVAVAMRGDAYRSRGVDVEEAREVTAETPKTPAKNREMKASGAKKYQTR